MDTSYIVKAANATRKLIAITQGRVAAIPSTHMKRMLSHEEAVGHAAHLLSEASALAQKGRSSCAIGMLREAQGMLVGARVCMLGDIKEINEVIAA